MSDYTIDFEPLGRRGKYQGKESLLDCARQVGIGISSICGGKGTCQSCKVRILSGTVSKPMSNELQTFTSQELGDGWRLACQTYPNGDVKLTVPPESMTTPQRVQVEGLELKVSVEPPVQVYRLKMAAPSILAPEADADRLLRALNRQYHRNCEKIDFKVLRNLSEQLREQHWECQAAVRDDEVITILPWAGRQLGVAVDLGTTKIAGYLVDLNDGHALAANGVMNPQISYGEDIISRITHVVQSPESGVAMQKLAVTAINDLATELCVEAGTKIEEILEVVVVGNTAMHHLFLGLQVRQLALSPFVPAVSQSLDVKANQLGINFAPGAYVHLLPNVAGFVGADHVAMLLAIGTGRAEGPTVAIDIGTNTEVSLINNGQIIATSCASGPAFEGGHTKDGMRAAAGAIERLRITDGRIQYQTIGQVPPVGICGSGILDVMSQLYLAGIIDERGRITDNHARVRVAKGQREFVLVAEKEREGQPAITITQHDVREFQLAKAAIRTGIQALLESNHCHEDEIKQVIIAGAFGSYIDIASAVNIGMLPSLPLNRFRQAGNAAGTGARLALISLSQRSEARDIASRVKYIELASTPDFQKTFIQATYLGRYRIIDGHREAIN